MTSAAKPGLFGVRFADGEVIFREGEPGDKMYVIQEGAVEISSALEGVRTIVCQLDKGQFFGEMALLEQLPRVATATARGDTRVMVLDRESILRRVKEDPHMVLTLLRSLCTRVRSLNECLEDLSSQDSVNCDDLRDATRSNPMT